MPDVLIRNLSVDDLRHLDAQARRLGLSRADFLRRQLQQQARRDDRPVTRVDLCFVSDLLVDLGDLNVMRDAWS